ncbi:MAG: DUF177 domain-containing protein [Leptolyngbya sp.]|nr:DUF177 domain-containing protein [Candidatus Melainabacteria bacterium]
MKIGLGELRALPKGRINFDYNETLEGLDAVKPVVGELSVSLATAGMRLRGQVKTLLKLACHRCLKPYFQALTVDIDERFVNLVEFADSQAPETRDRELQKDDFFEALPEDGFLDISDVVYQAVTLATPVYCSCGEECPGTPETESRSGSLSDVSSKPGEKKLDEKSIDPRWNNLKSLLPKNTSGEES